MLLRLFTVAPFRKSYASHAMAPKKRAGAPAAAPTAAKKPAAASSAAAATPSEGRSHYLMKSEADVFSIDDLERCRDQTEPWDGVRNHQAKKVMQSMKVGDQAFFWASNCKEPGVVGIVEVAREAYPDPSQFDCSSKYHDASATQDSPRWFCVDVKLVRKLAEPIALAALRPHADGALAGMALFRQSRLSVQPVEPAEWSFVLGLEGAAAGVPAAAAAVASGGEGKGGKGKANTKR